MITLRELWGLDGEPDRSPSPVWLLDVDGVVNASEPEWGAAPHHGTAHALGAPYRMRWAPALVDRIRALHTGGRAEIVWCTTWCAYASQLERLFRLPPLDRAFADAAVGEQADALKVDAARRVLAGGRRLIWTDDEVVPLPGSELHAELTRSGRALLIRPRSRSGLTRDDMLAVEAFTGEVPAAGPTGRRC